VAEQKKKKAPPRKKPTRRTTRKPKKASIWRRIWRWIWRAPLIFVALVLLWVAATSFINPPTTPYMLAESNRHGPLKHTWVDLENIAPVMARSVVAAEDANYCLHWGFDIAALREAIEDGANRGASTLTQQVAKNVFLWHGRNYVRKALEAALTPAIELFWSKRRIVEVYLNVAEFDQGVFGVGAAAQHYFGVSADKLSASQAAHLAAILPNPKGRSASRPGAFTRNRAASIVDGAATIAADGRADCFSG